MNKNKATRSQKKIGVQYRDFVFDRAEIDEENRTVPIAFSSETPVERFFGIEILSHEKSAVDLGRLKDGGAVLVDHDPRDHIGAVESVSIDKDRVGRAVVRLGRSDRAVEIFNDIVDGIRRKISVGYRILEMVEDTKKNEFTATRWEPFEISFVSIPADGAVGVMRSDPEADNYETTIIREVSNVDPKDTTNNNDGGTAAPKVDQAELQRQIDAGVEQARKDELTRMNEITALGREHSMEDAANTAIKDGKNVDEFRVHILDSLKDSKPVVKPANEIGMTAAETKRFSLLRALNALANPNSRQAQEAAAFEIECSNAVAKQRKIDPQGFFVPKWDDLGGGVVSRDGMQGGGFHQPGSDGVHTRGVSLPAEYLTRDLSAGTATDGAELVATNLLSGSFIDVLRNMTVVGRMGARVLDGLQGDLAIPRKTSGSAAGWIATEGGNAAQSDPQFDQVTLTPKTAGVYTQATRQLLLQSSLDVEALLRQDLAAGMALLIDLAALYGSGASGQPTGIVNQTGVNLPTAFAAAVPTYAEVVAMESAVATDNALMGTLGYILETAMRGSLKTAVKFTSTDATIWEPGNTLNGYSTGVSNQVTSGDIFFGNFADLLIGAWGNLDLLIDPYTNSLSGTVRIVAHQSVDVAVRHGESFAFNNDTP